MCVNGHPNWHPTLLLIYIYATFKSFQVHIAAVICDQLCFRLWHERNRAEHTADHIFCCSQFCCVSAVLSSTVHAPVCVCFRTIAVVVLSVQWLSQREQHAAVAQTVQYLAPHDERRQAPVLLQWWWSLTVRYPQQVVSTCCS